MSNEELIEKYKQGYFQALDELTIKNMNLIKSVANQFYTKTASMEFDDLTQTGWKGFYRAVQTYNPNHESASKFSTWAIYWIRQRISRYVNQKTPKTDEVSLYETISETEDSTLLDMLPDPEAEQRFWRYLDIKELHQELEEAMHKALTLRQIQIIKLHYGWNSLEPMSFESIGKMLETSRQNVRQSHRVCLQKLRNSSWGRRYWKEIVTKKIEKYRDPEIKALLMIYKKEATSKART